MSKWNNIPGHFNLEIVRTLPPYRDEWVVQDSGGEGIDLPAALAQFFDGHLDVELTIHFLSSGYYDAGKYGGSPEFSRAPEGDEERLLDYATIDGKRLPQDLAELLFEQFQDEIDAVELVS